MTKHLSFNNSKQKILTLWEDSKQNKNSLNIQSEKNIIIKSNIKDYSLDFNVFNNIFESTTEWEDMTPTLQSEVLTQLRTSYSVELFNFPNSLIPFINAEIIHRVAQGDSTTGSSPEDFLPEFPNRAGFKRSTIIDVKDIEDNDSLKNVTVTLSMFIASGNNTLPYYQSKLLLQIINPREYI